MSPGTPDLRVVFVARAEGFRITREFADTREYRVGDRVLYLDGGAVWEATLHGCYPGVTLVGVSVPGGRQSSPCGGHETKSRAFFRRDGSHRYDVAGVRLLCKLTGHDGLLPPQPLP